MSKTQQILEMASKFEKLAFKKQASGDLEKLANLAMNYETTWQLLEDLATAQFLIIGINPETASEEDKKDPLFEHSIRTAEVIRSIIPAIKALDEEIA